MAIETYEFIVSGTIANQFVQNVFHVNVDNTAGTAPFDVATAILTKLNAVSQFSDKFLDCLPEIYVCTSLRCRRVLPDGGPTAIVLGSSVYQGTGARTGLVAVNTNSPLIIWLTALRPAKTGRTFFPGVTIDDCENNVLQSGLIAALVAFGTYWTTGGTLTSPAYAWSGVILRRALNTADDIGAMRVSPIVGNQRRRQRPI